MVRFYNGRQVKCLTFTYLVNQTHWPKEQPPRKLSGKRTVTVITLESRRKPHRRIKSLRYDDQKSTIPTDNNVSLEFGHTVVTLERKKWLLLESVTLESGKL